MVVNIDEQSPSINASFGGDVTTRGRYFDAKLLNAKVVNYLRRDRDPTRGGLLQIPEDLPTDEHETKRAIHRSPCRRSIVAVDRRTQLAKIGELESLCRVSI
jgi:hypothetical protein